MARKQILVIGASAAGLRSASRARRRDQQAQITALDKDSFISYAACGIPFYLSGETELEKLLRTPIGYERNPEFFKRIKNIDVHTRTLVTRIDREHKRVAAIQLNTQKNLVYPYDCLVLALGAMPLVPSIQGITTQGVFQCRNLCDATNIMECMKNSKRRKAVLIGGGLVNLELLEPLMTHGFEVSLVEMKDHLLSAILDYDMAELVERHLVQLGISLYLEENVNIIKHRNGWVETVVTDKRRLPADLVILGTGLRPNVQLALDAGLTIGVTGGIEVNEYMQTSDPDIYAGGDCVETYDTLTGQRVLSPMGSVANKQGRVIGDNLTGGRTPFLGVLRTAVMKVCDFNVGRTGLGENEARRLGYEVEISINPNVDKSYYMKTVKHFILKLIADRKTRRLLGVQGVGTGDLVKRIDVSATAIAYGGNVDQLADLDLGYAPPFSAAIDNITETANMMRNKLDGLAETIHPSKVKEKLAWGDDLIMLDIRPEFEKHMEEHRIPLQFVEIPWIARIPNWELRERLLELDRNKETIIFCRGGVRTFEAYRLMKGAGFDKVKILDGSTDFWPDLFVYCQAIHQKRLQEMGECPSGTRKKDSANV